MLFPQNLWLIREQNALVSQRTSHVIKCFVMQLVKDASRSRYYENKVVVLSDFVTSASCIPYTKKSRKDAK